MRLTHFDCLRASLQRLNASHVGLLAVFLVLVVQPGLGFKVHRHPNCTDACVGEEDPVCRTDICSTVTNATCPAGTVQKDGVESVASPNSTKCYRTDCTVGGCSAGYKQLDREVCFDLTKCLSHAGVCAREFCCPYEPTVTCCEVLNCTVVYDSCKVPQQLYLTNASQSDIGDTIVGHGASATFPFYYNATAAAPGGSCDAVRVYGRCLCDDGVNVPGCEPYNSSSWYLWTDGPLFNSSSGAAADLLSANLSLTCIVLPPPPPPPPPPPAEAEENVTAQGALLPPPPAGGAGRPRDASEHKSRGPMVAMIVITCVLLAACIVVTVLWCCGLTPDLHNLRIRSLTSYEPMFTGQSYTPELGGRGLLSSRSSSAAAAAAAGASEDIPWTRFCAAVAEGCRRLVYGRRYVEESASAAAAAERYRTLNSLGRLGSSVTGAGIGGRGPLAKPTRGSVVLSTYPSSRHKAFEEELDVDEVFTLEDLGAGGSDTAGFAGGLRPTGRQPASPSGMAAAAQLPQSLRASSGAAAVTSPAGPWASGAEAAATTLSGGLASRGPSSVAASTATTPAGLLRPRLNQFGVSFDPASAVGQGGYVGDGGGPDVIHTRPLALPGDSGEYDEYDAPPDVDAPLHWLPTPQVTGQQQPSSTQQQAPLLPPPPPPAPRPPVQPPPQQQRGQGHHHVA